MKMQMQRCSFFIQDKALFGSFPEQSAVYELESFGVRYFVDLTNYNEKHTTRYITKYNYLKYPILDHKIPRNWKSFARLIITICNTIKSLKEGEKIYIHCRGGHGRSGMVVAAVLCYYYNMDPETSLMNTTNCHANRQEMRQKWRDIGSPQGEKQKKFIRDFFKPLSQDFLENILIHEEDVILRKFRHHPELLAKFVNTGLRPFFSENKFLKDLREKYLTKKMF